MGWDGEGCGKGFREFREREGERELQVAHARLICFDMCSGRLFVGEKCVFSSFVFPCFELPTSLT